MRQVCVVLLLAAGAAMPLGAQNAAPQPQDAATTLRVTSRAVVLDVLVTGKDGKPVQGLHQNDFTVTEQGKPQTISFFEEHHLDQPVAPAPMPKLPPNVFSNFSPYPLPPAVNVLLLDSLNTRMASQSWVHTQALKFLANTKPGTRTAIFTMGLGFHFIQGFTSDPAVLVAALKNKKNNEVQRSASLIGQDELNTQQNLLGMMSAPEGNGATAASPEAIAALTAFFQENNTQESVDRYFLTLENLQRLATFLNSFPGRKNVIWFSESIPAIFLLAPGSTQVEENPRLDNELEKTMAMLSAARVALYPVDARGVEGNSLYNAETVLPTASQPSQMIGAGGLLAGTLTSDDAGRNMDQISMQTFAEETGGRAFMNTNGFAQVIDKITASSEDFYTLSYAPADTKMNGAYRKIDVKVSGGRYNLAYRRGYYAVDEGIPGRAIETRDQALHAIAAQHNGAVDPLLPFMSLGMPQSDQILYEAKVTPEPPGASGPDKGKLRYGIDFAVDIRDLMLVLDPDGKHRGVLNITLLVYDRYGNVVSHQEHLAALVIPTDAYAAFQTTGLQLHADIAIPKGNYWLRTGIYDENTRKVGTLEIPLAAVKPAPEAAQRQP